MASDPGFSRGDDPDGQPNLPPGPPPLPAASPPPLPPQAACEVLHGRLHPCTFVFVIWGAAQRLLIPAIIVLFAGTDTFLAYIFLVFMVLALVQGVIRYFTFSFRLDATELVTQQGLLERTERHIPLERIQDLRLEQGILHRILGMVDAHLDTAGGQGAEASLSVLSKKDAERFREAIFARIHGLGTKAAEQPSEPAHEEVIRRLSVKELIQAGLTSNRAATFIVLIFGALHMIEQYSGRDNLFQTVGERVAAWTSNGGVPDWTFIAAGAALLIIFGILFSAAGSVLLFHGFTLSRQGEDLRRQYGAMTKRSASIPRKRIQLLKVEETLLRRMFKLATIRADTAGGRPQEQERANDGRDVMLPVIRRNEVDDLLRAILPQIGTEQGDWRKVSPQAIARATIRASVFTLIIGTIACLMSRSPWGAAAVLIIPISYWGAVQSFKRLGYRIGPNCFWTRLGWIGRATYVVPLNKTQSLRVVQNPFDRRRHLATLQVDTAGQATTGGAPEIRNLPDDEALLVARELARRASESSLQW